MTSAPSRHRWWLLGSLWSLYAAFGLVAGSLAPLLERVRLDLDMSQSAMGAALGAWPFVYLFVAIWAGRVLDRVGLRWGLAIGAAGIALSGFARALAQGPVSLWFAVALFGLGGPFVSVGAPKLVAEHFGDAERGRAVGLYSTASSLGNVIALVAAVPLRSALGSWRWVVAVFALGAVLAGLVWIWVGRAERPSAERGEPAAPALDLLRDTTVRWVMVLAVGAFFVSHSLGGWMPEMLREVGWSETGASWLVAAGILFGILGSLVVPPLATPARRGPMLAGVFLLLGGCVWLLLAQTPAAHVAAMPVMGMTRVTLVPIAMLILMSAPGINAQKMGAAGGLFFTAGEVGGVAGPWLTGVTRDLGSDFRWSVLMLSVLAVGLAVAALVAARQPVPSSDARVVPHP